MIANEPIQVPRSVFIGIKLLTISGIQPTPNFTKPGYVSNLSEVHKFLKPPRLLGRWAGGRQCGDNARLCGQRSVKIDREVTSGGNWVFKLVHVRVSILFVLQRETHRTVILQTLR
jgi:hypothetical protein